jgi:hypothetical protein
MIATANFPTIIPGRLPALGIVDNPRSSTVYSMTRYYCNVDGATSWDSTNFDTVKDDHMGELYSGQGGCSPCCSLATDNLPLDKVNDTLESNLHASADLNCNSQYTKLCPDLVDHSPWVRAWSTSVLSKEDRASWENKLTCPSC